MCIRDSTRSIFSFGSLDFKAQNKAVIINPFFGLGIELLQKVSNDVQLNDIIMSKIHEKLWAI